MQDVLSHEPTQEVINILDLDEDADIQNLDEVKVEDEEEESSLPEEKEAPKAPEAKEVGDPIERPRKKAKPRPSERIRQVVHQKKAFENAAYTLFEENKAQKEKLIQKDRAIAILTEDMLKTRAENARQAYERAREMQDIEEETKAQRYLIQYENELYNLNKSKNQNQSYEEEDISDYLKTTPQDEISSYQEEWLIENDWFDESSSNYDPELAEEAYKVDAYLAKKYKLERKSNLIGTPQYLEEISSHIRNKYLGTSAPEEDYDGGEEEYEDPIKPIKEKPRQPVAPVNRASSPSPYTNQPTSSRTVKLDADEKAMALSMEYGKPLSPQEKIKLYADYKYKLMKQGKL